MFARFTEYALHLCPEMHAVARITNITTVRRKIPKITIIAKITNEANGRSKNNNSSRQKREGGPKNITKITKITNIAKKTSQATGSSKNNNSSRQTRKGGPTNITKITNLAKITSQATGSSKNNNS